MGSKADLLNMAGRMVRKLGIKPSNLPGSKHLFRMLSAITGELTVEAEGLRLTGSFWHRRELWKMKEGRYEKFTVKLFKKAIAPGMVVCDIGAHIGFYALLAAQRIGASGRIYAFEPDPRTFPFLLRNIKQNRFSNTIIAVDKAIADREGILKLNLDEITGGGSSLFRRVTSGRTVEVQSVKLDDFLPSNVKVDVIKIDIEGGELAALQGMEQVIKRSDAIKMFVECNPFMLQMAGSSVEELLDRLHFYGFEVRAIDDNNERLEIPEPQKIFNMFKKAKTPTWSINLYCVKGG